MVENLTVMNFDLFLEIGALMAVSVAEVVCRECPHSSGLLVLVLLGTAPLTVIGVAQLRRTQTVPVA
jgi:hypothetical protein